MPLRKLENVTKRFGGLVAVDDVSLEVKHGEIIAIVGPNGAGKTTLFNVINGVFLPDAGKIYFEGKEITNVPTFRRAPLGIGRTFRIPRPFGSATVRENVAIGGMFGAQMVELIKQIRETEKIAIVSMVEHIMRAVAGLAERVMVMHQGAKLVDEPTKEALSDPRVVEVYLGRPPEGTIADR